MLEEKTKPSFIAYRPPPKIPVEPRPRVDEIVVRDRRPERVVVEPRREPQTEVEEIVLRERKPQQIRTVYAQPRQQKPQV